MSHAWNYDDLLEQFRMMRKMGPLQELIKKIPGVGKMISDEALAQMNDRHISHIEAIIFSMTPRERRLEIDIDDCRRERIAMGSGATTIEVAGLEKQLLEIRNFKKREPPEEGSF